MTTYVIPFVIGMLLARDSIVGIYIPSLISASLTRRIVVTATRTGLPNPCLHQATGSIPYFLYFSVCLHEVIA